MSRYKIVVIATDNPTPIVRVYSDVEKSKFRLVVNAKVNDVYKEYVHLYIVDTQTTIKRNDWVIFLNVDKIEKIEHEVEDVKDNKGWIIKKNPLHILCNKIIASTDTTLGLTSFPQHLIDGVIEHGIDYIVIEDCYYAGDVFTVQWAEKPDFDLGDKIDAEFERYRQISKPQVDFDLLKNTISILGIVDANNPLPIGMKRNLQLFFELEEVKRIINK